MTTRNISKKIKLLLSFCLLMFFITSCISSYVGYNGYQKWKYRRSSFGNRQESIDRKVFVQDLKYSSNLKLDSFYVYIEKGFKYGHKGANETVLLENDQYPYQICYDIFIDKLNIYGYENSLYKIKIDTMASVFFLEKPELKTPFVVKISKLENQMWDSIGYIKVWDVRKTLKEVDTTVVSN